MSNGKTESPKPDDTSVLADVAVKVTRGSGYDARTRKWANLDETKIVPPGEVADWLLSEATNSPNLCVTEKQDHTGIFETQRIECAPDCNDDSYLCASVATDLLFLDSGSWSKIERDAMGGH